MLMTVCADELMRGDRTEWGTVVHVSQWSDCIEVDTDKSISVILAPEAPVKINRKKS